MKKKTRFEPEWTPEQAFESGTFHRGPRERLRALPRWKKAVTGGVLIVGLIAAFGDDDSSPITTVSTDGDPSEAQGFAPAGAQGDPDKSQPGDTAETEATDPTAVPAPSPTRVPQTPTPEPATATATATTVPPTAVPPTAVPPTAIPATAVPATAVPPTAVPPTVVPPTAVPATAVPQPVASSCHPSYTPCVPNVAYDLNCGDIGFAVRVIGPDTYGFDGSDADGLGCESYG